MGILKFEKVTKEVEELPFDCGVASINEYVINSYYPTIVQHAYAYTIKSENVILGYFQIMFRDIEIGDFPEDIAEYNPGVKEERITAVHIRYIAIKTEYQKNKIGTNTLRTIIKNVLELAKKWPIRVITIDAKADLVYWYEREGFIKLKNNAVGQDGFTVAMYFDCMQYSQELQDYLCENMY